LGLESERNGSNRRGWFVKSLEAGGSRCCVIDRRRRRRTRRLPQLSSASGRGRSFGRSRRAKLRGLAPKEISRGRDDGSSAKKEEGTTRSMELLRFRYGRSCLPVWPNSSSSAHLLTHLTDTSCVRPARRPTFLSYDGRLALPSKGSVPSFPRGRSGGGRSGRRGGRGDEHAGGR
jgi:hypothetical protein